MKRKYFLLLTLLLLFACNRPPVDYRQQLYVFGTLMDLHLIGKHPAVIQQAITSIDHDFQRMHREWHGWKPGGELYAINQAIGEGRKEIPISEKIRPLLISARQLSIISGGLFEPGMGRLINLWGFQQDERPSGEPPTEAEINSLLERKASISEIKIERDRLISSNKTVNLDLGAFAKGYALDQARQSLKQAGIKQAMLNAGGDLCVLGENHNRPWHVGLRHPQGKGVLASIRVKDGECVMTSGNYERYREHKGVHYAHILDPRTGKPVQGIVSVTVIDADGGLADAAATALTVAGSEGWYALAKGMGLKYVMLVGDDGVVYMNPGMGGRIEFEGVGPDRVVVSGGL